VKSFSIVTTVPNPMVAKIHDRMPVIIHPDHFHWWIDAERKGDCALSIARPYPAEDMDCVRVSTLVNNARNDVPECLQPA
jgi:putative SOS response-associated peptidase YedK